MIHPAAELHPTVRVGAHAVVGERVKIGPETVIGARVVLDGWTEIGARNQIFPGAAIGLTPPEHLSDGSDSLIKIGNDNQLREFVTIHRSAHLDDVTSIGNGNLLMAYTHVAHGCVIENQVIIANAVMLGDHVHIESKAVISGIGSISRSVHVGQLVMVAFMHQITQDIPPFMLVEGTPARVRSLNRVGLKRAGLVGENQAHFHSLKTAFRLLYRSGLSLDQALDKLASLPENEYLLHLKRFLQLSQMEGRLGLTPSS